MLLLLDLFEENKDAVRAAMAGQYPDTVQELESHAEDLLAFTDDVVAALDEVDHRNPINPMTTVVAPRGTDWSSIPSRKRRVLVRNAFEELATLGYYGDAVLDAFGLHQHATEYAWYLEKVSTRLALFVTTDPHQPITPTYPQKYPPTSPPPVTGGSSCA